MNSLVVGLQDIGKNDIGIAGGKGANLGEIVKLDIPVPEGFIVTTIAFGLFLQKSNLNPRIKSILRNTNVEDTSKLFESSKKIKSMILSSKIPAEVESDIITAYRTLGNNFTEDPPKQNLSAVAVRSSATAEDLPTASFAGQQATYLNVIGEKNLLESVRKCWASLFEPRAIFYRKKHDVLKSSIAVIVQRMVNSDKSGIIFTVDPSTGENVLLFEAIWGLGESIVGGKVTPDMYKVSKGEKNRKILDMHVSSKTKMLCYDSKWGVTIETDVPKVKATAQVLSHTEITELAKYSTMLEDHFAHPQDIEFAIENGRVMILQSRAVTTSARQSDRELKSKDNSNRQVVKGIGASPGYAVGVVKVIKQNQEIAEIEGGEIIVTAMTSPDLVPAMSKSAAIITDLGGLTCHAAIVSRELEIPAIVGTGNATTILRDGQEVTVDAYNGIVYEGKIRDSEEIQRENIQASSTPTTASLKTNVKVKVNLAFPSRLSEIVSKTDGVGLLRIEHMIAKSGQHPGMLVKSGRKEDYIDILMEGIRPIAKAFKPKPVRVRTLDARSDEFRNLKGGDFEPLEANPMLGWHGIRRALDEPELLKAEFKALNTLYSQEELTNLEIMIPFVISVQEVKAAMDIAKEAGIPPEMRIGIMVETPASVMIIKDMCKLGINFASFGTNDLVQLILGIDRNNEKLAKSYNPFHPAVLDSLKKVIEVCNEFGIESSICGESGSSPEMARILVNFGIKSISCNIDAVDTIRRVVFEEENLNKL